MQNLLTWITGHWGEISAAVISLIYLYFSYKQNILLWPFGLLSALFYIWIYYNSGFYADMSLQGYYVVISVYGWYHWTRGHKSEKGSNLKISRVKKREGSILFIVFLLLWLLISQVLIRFTDSQIPVMDALTTAGSIVATWMLARKIIEHWLLWIIIDTISLGLYIYKDLYATAVLFLIYTFVAIAGYFAWKRDLN